MERESWQTESDEQGLIWCLYSGDRRERAAAREALRQEYGYDDEDFRAIQENIREQQRLEREQGDE